LAVNADVTARNLGAWEAITPDRRGEGTPPVIGSSAGRFVEYRSTTTG
jgi:hypothetical protein